MCWQLTVDHLIVLAFVDFRYSNVFAFIVLAFIVLAFVDFRYSNGFALLAIACSTCLLLFSPQSLVARICADH